MQIPGPCSECKRQRILTSCSLCGAPVCPECARTRHDCSRLAGSLLQGAWADDEIGDKDLKK